MVREIVQRADDQTRRQLADLLAREYSEFSNPDVAKLERVLTDMRGRLVKEARDRGFDV